MKSFVASTVFAFLAASAFASPVERETATARVSLSNDMSGANAPADIPLTNTAIPITQAYANTNVANGGFLASSTSLVGGFSNNPICTFKTAAGVPFATLTTTHSFVKLGSNPNIVQNINLTGSTITCST